MINSAKFPAYLVFAHLGLGIAGIILMGQLRFPAILNLPGHEAFPFLQSASPNGWLGFKLFLLHQLLFWPVSFYVTKWSSSQAETTSSGLQIAQGFAVASSALRGLWWGVWITAIAIMVPLYTNGNAVNRDILNTLYIVLNETFSTINEDIGVDLFGGIWGLIVSVTLIRSSERPNWIGYLGVLSGLCYLISTTDLFGLPKLKLAEMLAPTLTSVWLLSIGIAMLLKRYSGSGLTKPVRTAKQMMEG